jgi:hypothetical protein
LVVVVVRARRTSAASALVVVIAVRPVTARRQVAITQAAWRRVLGADGGVVVERMHSQRPLAAVAA